MNIRISATREMPDARVPVALDQPHRRGAVDPLDPRLECPLGRLRLSGRITEAEYRAGCQWRGIYHRWLSSIGAPDHPPPDCSDEEAEAIARTFKIGERVLKALGPRVFHAVSAVAVYEEPEELGDFEFTAIAAKKGLTALADVFG